MKMIVTSLSGAMHVLDLARQLNVKVLPASTFEIYDDSKFHPQVETYNGNVSPRGPIVPRACYDEGKRCAETLFYIYKRQLNVDVRVARIFNTYGIRMSAIDGRVVSDYVVQALKGSVTLHRQGKQTRSFCYVDDLIEGLISLMDSDYDKSISLGNIAEFTVAELAEIIPNLTNSLSIVINRDGPVNDTNQRQPDILLAHRILDWNPKTELEKGLQ